MTTLGIGYWCEVTALMPSQLQEWRLGVYRARSPRLAIRWLCGQAVRVAKGLDPKPGEVFPDEALHRIRAVSPNPGRVLRAWSADLWAQSSYMDALASGRHISIQTGGPDRLFGGAYVDVFYSLSARPISVKLKPYWQLREHEYAAA